MTATTFATAASTRPSTDPGPSLDARESASAVRGAERLRIAVVTPILPVPHDMTRGRFTFETVRALSRLADVRVFFQTTRYPRLPGMKPRSYVHGTVQAGYTLPGLDVEAFDYPAVPVLTRAINGVVGGWALRPRVQAFRPDLVLGYWAFPDGHAALRTARALGVPCVIGALGTDIHVRSGLTARMTRLTLTGADAVVTVSEAMRRTTMADFGVEASAVHTVVNGFNTSVFGLADQAAARRALGLQPEHQIAVYVGRFIEAKGLRELITAARQLAQSNPRFRLVLIGDGGMKAELHALIASSGLSDKVILPGGQSPEKVAQWICASDVLTLPSWSEGYPNVVVEAVACGRPVVASDVGGMREILNADNGILIPPKDPAALCSGLERALARTWDHAAIAAAMRRTWDDVGAETLAVCERVAMAYRSNRQTSR